MSKKNIDLRYASNSSAFFSGLNKIKNLVRQKSGITSFNQEDENEIGRGKTYAVFPELQAQQEQITIQHFRDALHQRGVTNESFQNKILAMLLQNRAGINFRFGMNILDLFDTSNAIFTLDENREVKIDIVDEKSVGLTYKAIINEKDPWTSKAYKAFEANVTVNISPEKVIIKAFDISKTYESEGTNDAYRAIQNQQQNILMKLLTYIKHALGFDSELRIEETQEDQTTHRPSP